MKKIVRLTESDLIRIVKRVINEQFYGDIVKPEISKKSDVNTETPDYEKVKEFESEMMEYKKNMDLFLDELKQSVDTVDGKRFLKQVQNQTGEIYWKYYNDSSGDERKMINDKFSELQLGMFDYFRKKLHNK